MDVPLACTCVHQSDWCLLFTFCCILLSVMYCACHSCYAAATLLLFQKYFVCKIIK